MPSVTFAGKRFKSPGPITEDPPVSERQVRLLYRTTCRACGDGVAAGTVTWWDDERRHATCTTCFEESPPTTESWVVPDRAERRARLLRLATSA